MNLQEALRDYLAMRRGLGFKLHTEGTSLVSFISFLEQQHQAIITTEFALTWAKLPSTVQPAQWARRLSYVRAFARYCTAIDSRSQIPPGDLLPMSYQRPAPYLFTDGDIRQLLQASQQLSVNEDFFAQTLYCLFGLLSVTGLRISEALDLTLDDMDLETGVLIVRQTKFGKSRLLPLHDTTVTVLVEYREQREKFLAGKQIPSWFVNRKKARLSYDCVKYHFDHLLKSIGVSRQTGNRRPHLHDLRHYFALSVLLKWYREKQDVERLLPILSAYLGHVETRDTYWYLSACPELMNAANERLEKQWEKRS